jgi:hypothetical protein
MIESMAMAGAEVVSAVAVTMAADALVMSMTPLDDSANTRVNTIDDIKMGLCGGCLGDGVMKYIRFKESKDDE